MRTAVSQISYILRWPGINLSAYGLWATASLQIPCVLKQSGVYTKRFESICTASLYISCVLKWSGTTIIKRKIIADALILFISLCPGWGKNIPWDGDLLIQKHIRYPKTNICCFHNFCVSFFSSLGTHQSRHLDGCQAIGINSFFIFAFWTLCFWWPLYHSIISSSS